MERKKPILANLYENKTVKKYIKTKDSPTRDATGINYRDRVMIVGGSGSGKSHSLLHFLLLSPDTFTKIIVVNKGIEEPIYETLKDKLKSKIVFYELHKFPDMNTLVKLHLEDENNDELLILYDDIVNDLKGNETINNYFIAGRKQNMTQIFLSQSYFKVPKVIRLQLTHLILLKLSSVRDLNIIMTDYTLGIEKEELKQLYQDATSNKFHFLLIDINSTDENRKFSYCFNDWYKIS